MSSFDMKSVYTIAKKEFMDNFRNKWIIALTAIFMILTIVASYQAGGQAGSMLGNVQDTVVVLLSIAVLLVPIIAIMLGYATIAGEAESGALAVVLGYPVRRGEVLFGKIFGLGAALSTSIILGFGISGAIIVAVAGADQALAYLGFIGLTILLGFLYLNLSIFFSSIMKRRSTSLGAGVMIFFWAMIYGMLVFAVYLGTGGSIGDFMGGSTSLPEWFYGSVVLSPADTYQMASMSMFGISDAFGASLAPPAYMTLGYLTMVLLIWTVVPVILSYVAFRKRDI